MSTLLLHYLYLSLFKLFLSWIPNWSSALGAANPRPDIPSAYCLPGRDTMIWWSSLTQFYYSTVFNKTLLFQKSLDQEDRIFKFILNTFWNPHHKTLTLPCPRILQHHVITNYPILIKPSYWKAHLNPDSRNLINNPTLPSPLQDAIKTLSRQKTSLCGKQQTQHCLATGYFDGIFGEPSISNCKLSWMDVLLVWWL